MSIKTFKQTLLIISVALSAALLYARPVCAETVLKESTTVYTTGDGQFHLKQVCNGTKASGKTTLAQALGNGLTMCKSCAEEIGLDEATRPRLSINLLPYRTPGTISDSSESTDSSSNSSQSSDTSGSDSGSGSSDSNDASSDSSNSNSKTNTTKTNTTKTNTTKSNSSNSSSKSSGSSKSSSKSSGSGKTTVSSGNSSSSGDVLMTEKQRRNRFRSKTNPKRGTKPATPIRPASGGFSYANFGTYNSYSSENHIGRVPIYLLGTIMDMQPVKQSGSTYSVDVMVNDCDGYQWQMRCTCDKSKYDLMKTQLLGKNAYIYGTYAGYSGVSNRPMMDMTVINEAGGVGYYNLSIYR